MSTSISTSARQLATAQGAVNSCLCPACGRRQDAIPSLSPAPDPSPESS